MLNIKTLFAKEGVQNVSAWMAAWYVRFVIATTRWHVAQAEVPQKLLDEKQPFIMCFWHEQLLMMPAVWQRFDRPFYMLISPSRDGRLIAKTVSHFKLNTIAGSSNKNPLSAIRQLTRLLREGHCIGITPDGPKGPAQTVQDGATFIARKADAPLVPVALYRPRHKKLDTWDCLHFPLPFGKGRICWGQPLAPDSDAAALKQGLDAVCQQAQQPI